MAAHTSQASPRGPRRLSAGLVTLTLLAGALYLTGLGWAPLWDEDETWFGSVAREMLHSGDWIVPRYNGELADHKPAGLFWKIAAGFLLFGESPEGARFFSAICGIAVVVMTWALGRTLYGPREAFWGGLALCTSLLFVLEARAATVDTALLAVIAAMLLLVVRTWWKGGRFQVEAFTPGAALAIGALAGAGILFKGLVALVVPLFCFFLFALWVRSADGGFLRRVHSALRIIRPFWVFLGALAVAGPWHIAVGWRTDGEWLRLFYWKHHVVRSVSVMEGHGGVPFLQLPMLFAGLFPWSVFLPLALWRTWRSAACNGGDGGAAKLLIAWSGVWLLLFSLTATQLPNYVLPAYPALCLCIGNLVSRALASPGSMADGWMYTACAGLTLGGMLIGAGLWCGADYVALDVLRDFAWLGLVPITGAMLAGIAFAIRRRKLAMATFVFAAVALLAGVFFVAAPRLGKIDPIAVMVRRADELAGGRAEIGAFRFTVPGVVWSADRIVTICASPEEAAALLKSAPRTAFLFVAVSAYEELAASMPGGAEIIAEGSPLSRRGKVLLVRSP